MTHGWLQTHFRSFVLSRPGVNRAVLAEAAKLFPSPYFTGTEMTAIKAAWRSAKVAAHGRRIILAGRDVWIFEVLARREQANTLFLPALSRNTVSHAQWHSLIKKDDFLFDTGFSGTIPQKLKLHAGAWKLLSTNNLDKIILKNLLNNRDLALKIERTPKYWRSAHLRYGIAVLQELAELSEFLNAALLTEQLYKDSSPRCAMRAGLLKRNTQFTMPKAVIYAN